MKSCKDVVRTYRKKGYNNKGRSIEEERGLVQCNNTRVIIYVNPFEFLIYNLYRESIVVVKKFDVEFSVKIFV